MISSTPSILPKYHFPNPFASVTGFTAESQSLPQLQAVASRAVWSCLQQSQSLQQLQAVASRAVWSSLQQSQSLQQLLAVATRAVWSRLQQRDSPSSSCRQLLPELYGPVYSRETVPPAAAGSCFQSCVVPFSRNIHSYIRSM
jgi:hypothetical protein